jgi:hypothetical protein
VPAKSAAYLGDRTADEVRDARITALLAAAEHPARPDLALRVRHFAGTFCCCKCGVQGPMRAPGF